MHNLQFSKFTMDPRNQRQLLPPSPSLYFLRMQQLLELQANTIAWYESYYGLPFCEGPVYQGVAQQDQYQYRAPSWGTTRNQHKNGFHKAEAQDLNNYLHESFGTIAFDRSTGIYPGYAWIDANNNTGAEKVWRPPSRNPLMSDHTSTPQMRTKPYNRDRSRRTQRKRTDRVDPSVYKIPIVKSKSMLILSILY